MRRVLVAGALAASIAVVVIALADRGTTRPAASNPDVYTQLARQLKSHLRPLVGALTPPKHAPTIQVPPLQGYSCETASGSCSLHPCVKYTQAVGDAVAAVTANRCNNTATATPRAIPIAVP